MKTDFQTLVDAVIEEAKAGKLSEISIQTLQMFEDTVNEVVRLRELAACCYAGLGAECNLPDNWLNVLQAAAEGNPFTTDGLLPYMANEG